MAVPRRAFVLRVGGVVEQAEISTTINRPNTLAPTHRFTTIWNLKIMIANLLDEYPMLLFVFEALLALGLLLFIVLWTGKGKK